MHRVTNGTPNAGTRQYFHKDHLGSVTAITDGNGNILQRMAFDPWGARRNINSSNVWQPTAMSHSGILASYAKTAKPYTSRGYTGHEMLDEVGIVHMNGRIYDANLARFLQADPFIQAPGLAASYNRYSYVMNNPMNAVDPSGYFFKKLKKELSRAWDDIRPYVGAIVGVALVYFTGGLSSSWFAATWYGAATGGAIAGAAGAAANGANLRGVLQGAALGAVSAAAFYGAGSAFAQNNCGSCYAAGDTLKTGAHVGKIAAHAAVGGVMSVLQGGKFGHGFSAAGFAQAFAPTIGALKGAKLMPARVAMASAIGGTASKLSGGKFANGAITGAFSRLFNDELHREAQTGPTAEEAWGRIDDFIKNNPDAPVPVSAVDFKAILDADAALSAALKLDGLSYSEYIGHIQGAGADSMFFQDVYRDRRFNISGHPTNGGVGVLGADINYYQVGMDTAAAGRSIGLLRGFVVGHNARDILNGGDVRHNMRQISSGQYWARVGYDHYSNSR